MRLLQSGTLALALLLAAPMVRAADFTNHVGMEFVTIPAGSFYMGSCKLSAGQAEENKKRAFLGQPPLGAACPSGAGTDSEAGDIETPQHQVTIGRAFQLGQTEVTLGQFKRFLASRTDLVNDEFMKYNNRGDRAPVVMVSWEDAQGFIAWLNQTKGGSDGGRYRLPSEAEWEYAARAGTRTRYSWGDQIGRGNAVCDGCGTPYDNKHQAPVASFRPNAFGLYDMHGNVWEWVEDCWRENYRGAPSNGGVWAGGNCRSRVLRGGSWGDLPSSLRAASRDYGPPGHRGFDIGFRVARTLTP